MLDGIGRTPKEVRPEGASDEVQEGDDAGRARGERSRRGRDSGRGGAVKEEREKAHADGVA